MKSLYISDFYFYVLSRPYLEVTVFIHIFHTYFYRDRNSRFAQMSQ